MRVDGALRSSGNASGLGRQKEDVILGRSAVASLRPSANFMNGSSAAGTGMGTMVGMGGALCERQRMEFRRNSNVALFDLSDEFRQCTNNFANSLQSGHREDRGLIVPFDRNDHLGVLSCPLDAGPPSSFGATERVDKVSLIGSNRSGSP